MPQSYSRKSGSPLIPRLLLVLLFVIWSNAFTAIKHLREILSPVDLVLARFVPVAFFCAAYLLLSGRRRKECSAIFREAPLGIIAMSLFGILGYNYFLYLGQSEIKPGAAALITTLTPLFTLVFALIFLREKVPLRRAAGIFIAFAGLYIVIRWGKVGLGRVTGISNAEVRYALITVLAPLSWTFYTIIGKKLLRRASPLTVTYLTIVIGSLPFLPLAGLKLIRTLAGMGPTYFVALIHLSVLCTLIGFWIWFWALHKLPATSVASFIYLNPPLAAFFGWLLYNEEVTLFFIAGSAVVLAGLYLAQGSR